MVEDTQPTVATPAPPTEAELLEQIGQAWKAKDFKLMSKLSQQAGKFQAARDKADQDAKLAVIGQLGDKVRSAVIKVLKPMYEGGDLDGCDGVWFTWDFGEKETNVRLLKSIARKSTGGGGGGKKYNVNTKELIDTKYGSTEYKDGMTFAQAWEHSTDKNWRYAIREKILKLENIL